MKMRHNWTWNVPETGQRRCKRCHLTLPIHAHVAVPPCDVVKVDPILKRVQERFDAFCYKEFPGCCKTLENIIREESEK